MFPKLNTLKKFFKYGNIVNYALLYVHKKNIYLFNGLAQKNIYVNFVRVHRRAHKNWFPYTVHKVQAFLAFTRRCTLCTAAGSGCGVHVVYRVARYDLLGRKLCQGFPSKDDNCKTVLFKRIFNEDHCLRLRWLLFSMI